MRIPNSAARANQTSARQHHRGPAKPHRQRCPQLAPSHTVALDEPRPTALNRSPALREPELATEADQPERNTTSLISSAVRRAASSALFPICAVVRSPAARPTCPPLLMCHLRQKSKGTSMRIPDSVANQPQRGSTGTAVPRPCPRAHWRSTNPALPPPEPLTCLASGPDCCVNSAAADARRIA